MNELIQAYKETDFNVYEPKITIKVGQVNQELDRLLQNQNCLTWAYITAWNPYSELTDDRTNEEKKLWKSDNTENQWKGNEQRNKSEFQDFSENLIFCVSTETDGNQ